VPPLVVASQLAENMNRLLQERLPDARILRVPIGAPASLPPDVPYLYAHAFPRNAAPEVYARPAGWPFGLKWVQLSSAGIDAYPRWIFDGPVVTNARGVGAEPIAEYVLAVLFEHAKRLPALWVNDPGHWKQRSLTMLRDSTLGIVGMGPIGNAIARKALALDMKVMAMRRSDAPFALPGITRAPDLGTLFERCDAVVLAAPSTPETRHMVNADVLARAKPRLHLINIGRGALIDHDALLAAVERDGLGRATLDVTDPEPLPAGHPLYAHPKVRISPHTSAISTYIQHAMIDKFLRNLRAFETGAPMEDVVDPDAAY